MYYPIMTIVKNGITKTVKLTGEPVLYTKAQHELAYRERELAKWKYAPRVYVHGEVMVILSIISV